MRKLVSYLFIMFLVVSCRWSSDVSSIEAEDNPNGFNAQASVDKDKKKLGDVDLPDIDKDEEEKKKEEEEEKKKEEEEEKEAEVDTDHKITLSHDLTTLFPDGNALDSLAANIQIKIIGRVNGEDDAELGAMTLKEFIAASPVLKIKALDSGKQKFMVIKIKVVTTERTYFPLYSYVLIKADQQEYSVGLNLSSTFVLRLLDIDNRLDLDVSKIASIDEAVAKCREEESKLVSAFSLNNSADGSPTVTLSLLATELLHMFIKAKTVQDSTFSDYLKERIKLFYTTDAEFTAAYTSFFNSFKIELRILQDRNISFVNTHVAEASRATINAIFTFSDTLSTIIGSIISGISSTDLEALTNKLVVNLVLNYENDTAFTTSVVDWATTYRGTSCTKYAEMKGYTETSLTGAETNYALKTGLKSNIMSQLSNTAPVAVDDAYQIPAGADYNITDLLTDDSDADAGDTLSIISVDAGTKGTVTIEDNGSVTFSPNGTFTSSDTFTYTVSDGKCGEDTGTVTMTPLAADIVFVSDPAAYDPQVYKNSQAKLYTIKNQGDQEATSLSLGGLTGSEWSILENVNKTCGATLAINATCTFDVQFTSPGEPIAGNPITDQIVVSYNNGIAAGQQSTKNVSASGSPETFSVDVLYSNAADWNYYVNDDGADVYSAGNVVCNNTSLYSTCIHGGEKKKVTPTGEGDCSGLTLSDELGVFDWTCVDGGAQIDYFMVGLKSNKGLKDLVTATDWKDNKVTLQTGTHKIFQSADAAWWTDNVEALPASGTLGTADKIYTLSTNATDNGWIINNDRIAIVGLGDYKISFDSGNNCTAAGESGGDARCVIASGGHKNLWLENLWIDGTDTDTGGQYTEYGILLYETDYSVLRQVKVQNATDGIVLLRSDSNYLNQIVVGNNQSDGLVVNGVVGTRSKYNVLSEIIASNNASKGVMLEYAQYNVISRVIAMANADGVILESTLPEYSAENNTLAFITTINNSDNGIKAYYTRETAFSQVAAVNNSTTGLFFDHSDDHAKFSQIVVIGNTDGIHLKDLESDTGPDPLLLTFTQNMILGNTGDDCKNTSVVDTTTIEFTNCTMGGLTTNTGATASNNTFVGRVSTSDASNQSDTSGLASFAVSNDWVFFDNLFRAYGKDDSNDFPHINHRGRCTAGNCRIWDVSLTSSSEILGIVNNGTDTTGSAFSNGAACPTAAGGNVAIQDFNTPQNTYLVNAFEVMSDAIGDDDGLCESNESCIYAPNFGAYQGSGTYTSNTCTFSDGTVSGVTMYAYPTNGVN